MFVFKSSSTNAGGIARKGENVNMNEKKRDGSNLLKSCRRGIPARADRQSIPFTFDAVVVGHGSQSMLGRVVGRAQL